MRIRKNLRTKTFLSALVIWKRWNENVRMKDEKEIKKETNAKLVKDYECP